MYGLCWGDNYQGDVDSSQEAQEYHHTEPIFKPDRFDGFVEMLIYWRPEIRECMDRYHPILDLHKHDYLAWRQERNLPLMPEIDLLFSR
jgi:hypothetical protein